MSCVRHHSCELVTQYSPDLEKCRIIGLYTGAIIPRVELD
jgi:hypothetical protein